MAKIQVAIIGAGPSGLLLSQLLRVHGIESIVLERQTREYVEARIRAGLLEWSTVDLLNEARVGARMMREGLLHDGLELAFEGRRHRIDLKGLTGQRMMVYGQTEIQKDLGDAHEASGSQVVWEAGAIAIHDFQSSRPRVTYTLGGGHHEIDCDFIAGCDGYYGVSRASIPKDMITLHERACPFGWIGILADVPPVATELIYVNHARGFSLCSMRSKARSRYYLQCSLDDEVENWPDERFWDELRVRLPEDCTNSLITGPSIEKSIAPLRSFVAEPMRFGQLFLVGDAAHIVPPTGAKGLNLAAADVRVLCEAIVEYYRRGSKTLLDEYSRRALTRVWKATRFSWWFTTLMHKFSDETFAHRMQLAELDHIAESSAAAMAFAENYVGLDFTRPRVNLSPGSSLQAR
jgi:p-hydroxybenzoate 3-monooxygenase